MADRVKQTTTTTGTGTINLDGTIPTGAIGFVAGIGNGNQCYYCIAHQAADEWEIGVGTVTDSATDTLSRTTIFASSNSGSAVTFSSGTKDVFVVAPVGYGIPYTRLNSSFAVRNVLETLNSSTAGSTRGTCAVDMQLQRNSSAQIASGNYSTICGGRRNTASNTYATVSGGTGNTASGSTSTIGGGTGNTASGGTSTIAGGSGNTASGSGHPTVCGGLNNTAAGNRGFVGGGGGNNAGIQAYTTIAGGYSNSVTGSYGGICCGGRNKASGGSFVGGGDFNRAYNSQNAIGGGSSNFCTADLAWVGGGNSALADKYGMHAHASGGFNNRGDAQTGVMVARIATTNATPAEMFLNGSSQRMTLPNDSTWAFNILVVARRTNGDNESAGYLITGVIDRNGSAGTTALVGTPTVTVLAEDNAGWDVAVTADTSNGSLKISVTGEASKNIQWVARIETAETTG